MATKNRALHRYTAAMVTKKTVVSIKQVAKLAGVSTATVSRTLKLPDVVTAETREKVMSAVTKLGYTPNFLAANLRTARSQVILVIVPDIGNPFFSEIIKGMEQVAQARGYSLLLGDSQHSAEREFEYGSRVAARQADGLITLSGRVPFKNYREQLRKGVLPPMVNACEYIADRAIPTVQIDNQAAAFKAMQYLLDLGHKHIGFVTGPMTSTLSTERLKGYQKALQSAGRPEKKALIVHGDFTAESGVAAAEQLLALAHPPTAIFCSNDEMAIGAIKALKSHGIAVPAQMSVMGFDDIPLARYFDPPLTTVLQPKLEIGREAMKILLDMLAGQPPATKVHSLPFRLVVRASTGRCKQSR